MMKVCKCCGQELPLSMFPTNRHHRYTDGHLPVCLDCFNARCELMSPRGHRKPKQDRERRERKTPLRNTYAIQGVKAARIPMTDEERAAKRREYQRAYYRAHPEYKVRKREIATRWCKEHPERRAKMQRDFYERNKDKIREYSRQYYHKKSWKNL